MKNNGGLGLYEIGERHNCPCGCVIIAAEVGYVQYIHPDCPFDNRPHVHLRGYRYLPWEMLPQERTL